MEAAGRGGERAQLVDELEELRPAVFADERFGPDDLADEGVDIRVGGEREQGDVLLQHLHERRRRGLVSAGACTRAQECDSARIARGGTSPSFSYSRMMPGG